MQPGATPPNAARYGKVRYAEVQRGRIEASAQQRRYRLQHARDHNWIHDGYADKVLRDIYRALKPRRILASRASRRPSDQSQLTGEPFTGYVPASVVVATVRKAASNSRRPRN
jgi:predicted methyltransferase